MYDKLARGYATAFANTLTDHTDAMAWYKDSRGRRALEAFEQSSLSRKPGRTLKRLVPLLRPTFIRPAITTWTRQNKEVMAEATTVARENRVFKLPEDAAPLYCERSVFRIDLILTGTPLKVSMSSLIAANIGHHALARLVERDCTTPENLPHHVEAALLVLRSIALKLPRTNLDPDQTWAFLIPFEDGALVAVTMDVEPYRFSAQGGRCKIISVRTFLAAGMLSEADHARMGGFESLLRDYAKGRAGPDPLCRWMEGNARPWSFFDANA